MPRSAAIYGARAAYGVILITTKKGKSEQKPQISVSASGYWQSPALRMHNINSLEYLEMRDIAAANSGMSSLITPGQLDYVKKYMDGSYKYSEFSISRKIKVDGFIVATLIGLMNCTKQVSLNNIM